MFPASMTMANILACSTLPHYDSLYAKMIKKLGIRVASCLQSSSLTGASSCYDVIIIGGGIVGTATARQLALKQVLKNMLNDCHWLLTFRKQ